MCIITVCLSLLQCILHRGRDVCFVHWYIPSSEQALRKYLLNEYAGEICDGMWATRCTWMMGVPGRFWNEVLWEGRPLKGTGFQRRDSSSLHSTCIKLSPASQLQSSFLLSIQLLRWKIWVSSLCPLMPSTWIHIQLLWFCLLILGWLFSNITAALGAMSPSHLTFESHFGFWDSLFFLV